MRAAGHALTAHIIEEWAGSDNFAKDPPNATVSAFSKDGSTIRDAVVELKTPKLEGDRLTFDVTVLEGDLSGADGAAAVFIDIIGAVHAIFLCWSCAALRLSGRVLRRRCGGRVQRQSTERLLTEDTRHRTTGARPADITPTHLATDECAIARHPNIGVI